MFCRLETLDGNTYNISTHLKVSFNLLQRIYYYKNIDLEKVLLICCDKFDFSVEFIVSWSLFTRGDYEL